MLRREKREAAADAYTAEQAQVLIAEHATEHEKATLDFSALAGASVKLGWSLTTLAAAASGEDLESRRANASFGSRRPRRATAFVSQRR